MKDIGKGCMIALDGWSCWQGYWRLVLLFFVANKLRTHMEWSKIFSVVMILFLCI